MPPTIFANLPCHLYLYLATKTSNIHFSSFLFSIQFPSENCTEQQKHRSWKMDLGCNEFGTGKALGREGGVFLIICSKRTNGPVIADKSGYLQDTLHHIFIILVGLGPSVFRRESFVVLQYALCFISLAIIIELTKETRQRVWRLRD